jgi:hypothetical protein
VKIKVWCDSGANIQSCREDVLDVEKDLGMSPEEWMELSEKEKYNIASEWANERLDIGYEEVEE